MTAGSNLPSSGERDELFVKGGQPATLVDFEDADQLDRPAKVRGSWPVCSGSITCAQNFHGFWVHGRLVRRGAVRSRLSIGGCAWP
jgi:hypothetical protein